MPEAKPYMYAVSTFIPYLRRMPGGGSGYRGLHLSVLSERRLVGKLLMHTVQRQQQACGIVGDNQQLERDKHAAPGSR